MEKKYIIILIGICLCSLIYSQKYISDWKDFQLPKYWTMTIDTNNVYLNFAERNTNGSIKFNYFNGFKTHSVEFYIFKYIKTDTILERKVLNWLLIQSCIDPIEVGKPYFKYFISNDYFYMLIPCHNCYCNEFVECQELAGIIEKKKIFNK